MVEHAAASIPGLAVHELLGARKSTAVKDTAATYDTVAENDNVNSTPTILVGKSGGALEQVALTSPTDESAVAAAIERVLR